jgi:hypothetical protein
MQKITTTKWLLSGKKTKLKTPLAPVLLEDHRSNAAHILDVAGF